ncbi:MAG: c-type cytochrome [Campylobacteraceae bacterium]
MRELKALAIVIIFTVILYLGIEPFAHTKLNPHVAPADFTFSDLSEVTLVGDAKNGKETFEMACIACHSLKADGYEPMLDDLSASEAYGVVVPDLSSAGLIYDARFLSDLIKEPAHALKLEHKFDDDRPFPMTPFYGLGGDLDQEVADMVAYLKSVAPKEMSDKDVFVDACLRCHDMKYAKLFSPTDKASLKTYMGMNPPDLSMMIRARSASYLETFINDPQKNLPGTSMPRVGLTKHSQEQVINYMESVGDSKKAERQKIGIYMMIFFVVFSVIAYMWKREVWKDLH